MYVCMCVGRYWTCIVYTSICVSQLVHVHITLTYNSKYGIICHIIVYESLRYVASESGFAPSILLSACLIVLCVLALEAYVMCMCTYIYTYMSYHSTSCYKLY